MRNLLLCRQLCREVGFGFLGFEEDVADVVFRADSAWAYVAELYALLDPVVVRANALVPCGHHPLNRPARRLVVVAQDRRRILNAVAEAHLLEQISYMFEFLRSRG